MQVPRYWRLRQQAYRLQGVVDQSGQVGFVKRQPLVPVRNEFETQVMDSIPDVFETQSMMAIQDKHETQEALIPA